MSSNAAFIKKCDSLLRAGEIAETARLLRQINTRQLDDRSRLETAKLCRRAGLASLGLKILAPGLKDAIASLNYTGLEPQIAEYAILLQRAGVLEESLRILSRLDGGKLPEVHLYTAFGHFARWDYAAAEPCLREYIRLQKDSYQSLVGRVNLAAALVHCRRITEARPLLEEILNRADYGGFSRLSANAHELSAELYIMESRWDEAESHLKRARATLRDARVHDQLFIELRQAQIDSFRGRMLDPLLSFRAIAAERHDWESVRESDLQLLKLAPDPERLHRLIAGTPHEAYRRRVLEELALRGAPVREYHLGSAGGPQLDLVRSRLGQIAVPNSLSRLMAGLTHDLYRPRPAGALFWEIYPGEHFDIFTSPNRIHRLILRARRFLKAHALPISIIQDKGSYSLRIDGECGIKAAFAAPEERSPAHVFVERARQALGAGGAYTNEDFRSAVGLEKSQVNALLVQSQIAGLIRILGKGRGTRYRFVSI